MKAMLAIVMLSAVSVAAQSPAALERRLIGYVDLLAKYGTYAGAYDEARSDQAIGSCGKHC